MSTAPPHPNAVNRRDVLLNARTVCLIIIATPATLLPRVIAEDAAPALPTVPTNEPITGQPNAAETMSRLLRISIFPISPRTAKWCHFPSTLIVR